MLETAEYKGLLILDLDETLIHCTYATISGSEPVAQRGLFYLYERPFLGKFLTLQSEKYDLAIWSASKADYVRWIIRSTSLRYFKYKFIHTRKHCKVKEDSLGSLKYFKILTAEMLEYDRIRFFRRYPCLCGADRNCRESAGV
jgi:hypothetical protein